MRRLEEKNQKQWKIGERTDTSQLGRLQDPLAFNPNQETPLSTVPILTPGINPLPQSSMREKTNPPKTETVPDPNDFPKKKKKGEEEIPDQRTWVS